MKTMAIPHLWVAAITLAPNFMLVRKGLAITPDLLAHEQVHASQMRQHGWLRFVLLYLLSRRHRAAFEVAAYRTSMANGMSPHTAAHHLATVYWLGINHQQALSLLIDTNNSPIIGAIS